ncbi:phosphotransferase family protein [Pelagibius sp. Alg239-R121]|uniref:phosphotransferase family protein n=1 Tax=Pelagibius sp. Alg239-R121 TaxID=2993448 RepID=UPI0024A74A17|nr:phosphotransferase [Pelagibius sp. Alg239-R121]
MTAFIAQRLGRSDIRLLSCERLEGGAVQENWRLVVAIGDRDAGQTERYVLRTDAKTALPDSRPKSEEFNIQSLAWAAGVLVPEPLWICESEAVIGAPFFLTREVAGCARGHAIMALNREKDGNPDLVCQLGQQLAKIHNIKHLPPELVTLREPLGSPAENAVRHWRQQLDDLPGRWPILEWSLRWCEKHLAAEPDEECLLHGDFRTGNYMVEAEAGGTGRLTGILDWEFASWGDPMSDIGWFCATCWRFDRPDLEAGGIGSRKVFYQAYQDASGAKVDPQAVRFWEVLAHIRWAVIAVQQGSRFFEGREDSLDLALTGRRRPAQIQALLLKMTAPEMWEVRMPPPESANSNIPQARPQKGRSMTDREASRRILASAATLFQDEIEPVLPANRRETGRMIRDALDCVLSDLEPNENGAGQQVSSKDEKLAAQIRNGDMDGENATHLALLGEISRNLDS